VQAFVRGFGLLDQDETPCGMPLQTSHAHALMILRGGGLHQAELARRLGIDKSNASRLVQQLVRKGHVATTAAEDARKKEVHLSTKGERLAASVERASRARFARLLRSIPPRHRRAVLDALAHLNHALTKERP
jgi:DNA-binding MarR family transcriptional regulator